MKLQKRHLTLTAFAVTLTLGIAGFVHSAAGRDVIAEGSHGTPSVCSHQERYDSGTSLATRARVGVKGHAGGGSLRSFGGQIG